MNVDFKEAALLLGILLIIIIGYYFLDRMNTKKQKKRVAQFSPIPDTHTTSARKATPQILQAYERLTILMERIDTLKLVNRVAPISELKQDYANFLIQNIDQEFDFNLSQQIYVSEEAWALVTTAKNTVIQQILKTSLQQNITNASDLKSELINKNTNDSVVELAKTRLRKEVRELV
ncbi:hypothetical protein QW060_07405 [Myroides ceti]|jgi:hypothetical protein|uniref:Uncharacterized protein n=1 Tax=Paenimyroides ceti TaxID=395087 RepID=A0ABT8CV38_9FLAO|nr:hypothetical protein [Paenimyroides ceti]MDN3706959.1 hypothetical protein [Paenimyroides ceti]